MRLLFTVGFLLLLGCPQREVTPDPPITDGCRAMCDRIGPQGLNCEEGESVYDSDLPGTPGVPNQTCEAFCEGQQEQGVNLHTQCVAAVRSCSEIEESRQRCGL